MAGRLSGKHAIITGAAQGIGKAIAEVFAAEGARLILIDLDEDNLGRTLDAVRKLGGDAEGAVADITDVARLQSIVAAALPRGRIDTVINNAGINVFRDPLTMTGADWDLCLSVDLKGAWNLTRACLPSLIDGGGSIVNIASSHSFTIIKGCFPYPVAKHGLIGLTRAMAIEYADKGVRCNAIAPGYVETQKAIEWWNTFEDPEAARQETYDLHPPKRICSPVEVARTAVFLASEEAPFINGAT
ncbi:MAG: SDR family oxidoreductase, partial [Alphaproteobacteria bacterium]